jgi:hypothetical protein
MDPEIPEAEWRRKRKAANNERRGPEGSPHWGLPTLPQTAGEWGIMTLGNHAEWTCMRQ